MTGPSRGLSPEEYRHLLSRNPIAMMVHDQNSRLLEANQACAHLLGYSLTEILRLDARDLVHPDDHVERDRETDALMSGAVDSVSASARKLLRKDGETLWVQASKSVIRGDNFGKIMVFFDKSWTFEVWREGETRA
ncbi:PAS domain S-box-containing protein [Rhodococcus tukisamuensis]|uniref:PAS domain S-box-containing protein n=2 Tax=Rhodococcus tukisamuensis TaxID=168276 RepID=A0A1G6U747_9NOCA|nr:PAS domain S-box-containing protein [Rhodococcus tukisamuensis]